MWYSLSKCKVKQVIKQVIRASMLIISMIAKMLMYRCALTSCSFSARSWQYLLLLLPLVTSAFSESQHRKSQDATMDIHMHSFNLLFMSQNHDFS